MLKGTRRWLLSKIKVGDNSLRNLYWFSLLVSSLVLLENLFSPSLIAATVGIILLISLTQLIFVSYYIFSLQIEYEKLVMNNFTPDKSARMYNIVLDRLGIIGLRRLINRGYDSPEKLNKLYQEKLMGDIEKIADLLGL